MPGVGVIFNPNAKRYKKNPDKLKRMAFIIGEKASGKPTQNIADLHVVADEFKSKDIDILAISGGDGTIHCTLTAFIKVYGEKPLPKIALLRGGTQNNIANVYGIKGDTEHLLSRLLLHYHENPDGLVEKSLRLMHFTDNLGGSVYGAVFGALAAYNYMEHYYTKPNLNKWAAIQAAIELGLSGLFNGKLIRKVFERIDAELVVDGQAFGFANFNGMAAGTVPMPGIGLKIFRHMLTQDERFHFLATSVYPRNFLGILPPLSLGRPPKSDNVIEALPLDLQIKFSKPIGYCVDGDMIGPATELRIQQGPKVTLLI